MAHFQKQHDAPPAAALSAEQFEELKELLRPGYELAKLYLAQHKDHLAAAEAAAADAAARESAPVSDVES